MNDIISPYFIQEPTTFKNNDMYTLYAMSGIPVWSYKYENELSKLMLTPQYKKVFDSFMEDLESNIYSGRNFMIYSKPNKSGTGKSTVLFNLAMKAVQLGFSGGCFYYSDLISLFREGLGDSKLQMNFKRFVQNKDFIIIDAFGSGYNVKKDYVISGLSDLLYYADTGTAHKVPVIISSIVGADDIPNYMDNSAYSKFYANYVFIELGGKDIRL